MRPCESFQDVVVLTIDDRVEGFVATTLHAYATLAVFHLNHGLDRAGCALYALAEVDIVEHHGDVERLGYRVR